MKSLLACIPLAQLLTSVDRPALACDLCAIYSAREAQALTGAGFFGGVAEQFTHFGTLQLEGHEVPGDGEYLNSSISQLFAGYNLTKRFGLELNLPVIYRWYGSHTQSGSVSGIGDLSLFANLIGYQKLSDPFNITWTLLAGVKFPTGDPAALGLPDSALPEGIGGHDIALGSGSYDGLLGTGVALQSHRLYFTANFQYAIRTEGAFQHQYANDLTWTGGPGYYLALKDDYTLGLHLIVSGETKGKDTFAGVPDPDSAETLVFVGPQIDFTWQSNLSAQLGADFAVSRDNSGLQLLPDYRVRAAITFRF